jgi:hypothetical protein
LEIDKSANAAQLEKSIGVENELTMTSGNLDLNGHDLTLGNSNGSIVGESTTSRILGPAGGELVRVANLNAPASANPGNLGVEITSTEDLGITEIRRGHDPLDILGMDGIERHFTITPTNNSGLDASARFHYFDAELNGITETELEPWRYNGTNWLDFPKTDSSTAANWVETANISDFSTWTLAKGGLKVTPTALLSGNYDGSGLMTDNLRTGGLIPLTEPFTGLGFVQVNGGGETIDPTVLNATGDDAIVDWVMLELRDKNDHTSVIRTRSALLQKDGDIVDLDGTSPVAWPVLNSDDYYLLVRHRNHLGIMSAQVISMTTVATPYDFTLDEADVYGGTNAVKNLGDGFFGLFSGDFDANGQVQNSDRTNLVPIIGTAGYLSGDLDLNGQVQNVDIQEKLTPNIGNGEQHN